MLRFFYILALLFKYFLLYLLSLLHLYSKPKAKLLKNFFEEAGGAFIKFGQLLALRVDVLPKEYMLEMIDLFDHLKPFPYKDVEKTFLYQLGTVPNKLFTYFEKKPFASASFGQVHAAKLDNDIKVVVKVQRPGISEKIMVDFFIIDILSFAADLFFKMEALPWKEFAREFKNWTRKELDYQIEAENTQKIYDNISCLSKTSIIIPKTYHRLTTKKILVQEYIDGIPLSRVLKELKKDTLTVKQLSNMGIDVKRVPETLIAEMMRQYFFDGFFHADPHPGNILLLENGKIGLIDFGISGVAAPKRNSFMQFIKMGAENQIQKALFHFMDFAGCELEQIVSSALPANIDPQHIEGLIQILTKHFANTIKEMEMTLIKNLEIMKIDYTVMVLQILKYSQRYHIKLPRQMVVFIRALSIIGFLAKEMNYEFRLTDVVLDFFQKYPQDLFPKKDVSILPYKRVNREEAIDRLNNWLTYILEIDPKLYQLVNNYISQNKFVVN